ncbi:serine hydrolase domain-containing protein [Aspergillus lucknowensis]|uniref:Beta-lactamase/transpeptidase-like protein n=1 Tax=Aspergillus lucknowensis TaxID=176173 RepID=A0ABR4LHQ1_9EURO
MWKSIAQAILLTASAAGEVCPLPGAVFPAPRAAANSRSFEAASTEFVAALESVLHPEDPSQPPAIDPDLDSFTVQVYGARNSKPLFEYYYTATTAQNNTVGVNRVDENTVFRIASCSKLWTVLLLLIEAGDASLHEPVAKYIPELQEAIAELKSTGDAESEIDHVRWQEVTIGELASQMSGLERQFGIGDLSASPPLMVPLGFPPLPDSEVPECGAFTLCSRSQFFSGLLKRHPTAPTSSSPVYSNDAYQLLGYVLETITGKTYQELVEERLIEPLALSRSTHSKPDDSVGIIPGPANTTLWDLDIGDAVSAGGLYSSTKDLSTLGRAILNYDLLSPALTRRWLKPVANTAQPTFTVGAPWEIFSLTEPRMISLYTKAGDLGGYSAIMGISPDHDAGFTILAAGQNTNLAVSTLADLVSTTMIPALDGAAKEEAEARFAGTYTGASNNASLTVTTDDGPGLKISKWSNNGKDMLAALAALQLNLPADSVDVRLFPTGLETRGKISFRSVVSPVSPVAPGTGPFTGACRAWMLVDGFVYGSVGVDEFVFDLGEDSNAVRVSPRALRASLSRNSS